ncbi:TetR/AcrR family transcriptional regulator [Kordiimonas sp. SCSIO 12610]|uniref:TetR/AcrR family transcriptional regulator n=1 Tax=Kordiimonas sp. SCSIO 12610 TaxID=2829597 RepID=UPI0021098949|nr:TetR/AcrR family transcriptional regulator [Kordiimonas sp. SCSIO 12610]UTW55083.1 TetR/AcrR family transcriptional regulator [Kordiimonas sp. SCSIO 12610]
MPRTAQLSKTERAQRLIPIFQHYGYDGATLNKLASATELSKASLYHHYPKGKEDMARHALAYMGSLLQKHVLAPLSGPDPEQAIQNSLSGVLNYYNGDTPICLMNSLMLGNGKTLFGKAIRETVKVWAKLLSQNIAKTGIPVIEAQEISSQTIEAIQGSLILCRIHETDTHLHDCIQNARKNILG